MAATGAVLEWCRASAELAAKQRTDPSLKCLGVLASRPPQAYRAVVVVACYESEVAATLANCVQGLAGSAQGLGAPAEPGPSSGTSGTSGTSDKSSKASPGDLTHREDLTPTFELWGLQGVGLLVGPASAAFGALTAALVAMNMFEVVFWPPEAEGPPMTPALRAGVTWTTREPIYAFTDGGCLGNGKAKPRASYAAVLTGGQFGRATLLRGQVQPLEYALADEAAPERGLRPSGGAATPSNNRGELLGILLALVALLRGRAQGDLVVVSDSDYSIKSLTVWYPAWVRTRKTAGKCNLDLIAAGCALLAALRRRARSVTFTHVNSHRPAPAAGAPAHERLLWRGNQLADEQCNLAFGDAAPGPHITALGGGAPLPCFEALLAD